jgi:3-mercaptopyruvate sulfurtransferase SseA
MLPGCGNASSHRPSNCWTFARHANGTLDACPTRPSSSGKIFTRKFKSPQDIKALIEKTGWQPNQEVVTYCMVGMRASLMHFAAKAAGIPARVYLGSWQEWSRDSKNPIVR